MMTRSHDVSPSGLTSSAGTAPGRLDLASILCRKVISAVIRSHIISAGIVSLLLSVSPAAAADIQVTDEGTLVVDGRAVQLWGIEALPAAQICTTTTGRSWPCGVRARDELRAALQESDVVCQPKAPGRELCRISGLDVATLLVKEGLARAGSDYRELEAQARSAKVGLWE